MGTAIGLYYTIYRTTGFLCLQMTVKVRVIFLKIGEIDTVKENFAADVFIQTKWKEPAFNGHRDLVSDQT